MIHISETLLSQIREESEHSYPNECCGIIFGRLEDDDVKIAEILQPVANESEDGEQYHRFLITSETMLEAELEARKQKKDIVGFYHSHPEDAAIASEYDKNHALPIYSYIITSVMEQKAVDVRSWELFIEETGSVFYPEDIIIMEKE